MIEVEVYANYALRRLLPAPLLEVMEGSMRPMKGNTILVKVKEGHDYWVLMDLCRTYGFQTKDLIKGKEHLRK